MTTAQRSGKARWSHHKTGAAWLATLLFAAQLHGSACSPASMDESGRGVSCFEDLDCGFNGVCFIGHCLNLDNVQFDHVTVEVEPIAWANEPAQLFSDLRVFNDGGRVDLALRAQRPIRCEVLDALDQPVAGRLSAELATALPQHPITAARWTDDEGVADLSLLPQETYALRFAPSDPQAVPLFPPALEVSTQVLQPDHVVTIRQPAESNLIEVQGRVVATVLGIEQGISNLSVQISAPTGSAQQVRVVSNRATTASGNITERGTFLLRLTPDTASGAVLHISATEQNPDFPTLELTDLAISGDIDLGDISLGAVNAAVLLSGQVTHLGQAQSDVTIWALGQVGAGRLVRSTRSAEDGSYQLTLPPGQYDVIAVPPPSSSAAMSASTTLDLAVPQSADFVLHARLQVGGRVLRHDGFFQRGCEIEALRIASADAAAPDIDTAARSRFQTTCDDSGAYALELDSGVYQITVIPHISSQRIATRRVVQLTVQASTATADITLHVPRALPGHLDSNNAPTVANARVRAYLTLEPGRAPLIAETWADDNGDFDLILPAFIGD